MARPLRLCVPGALYHVIARGNNRELVFREESDRVAFMKTLAAVVLRFRWLCFAYCLMDNHYHLVIETPLGNLSRGMRQLNGVYAQGFNRRYGRSGHLFEARFRSVLVEKETHLLEVCRYVVLNPVRAELCKRPDDWRWSSYRATLTGAGDGVVSIDAVLGEFGRRRADACERYRDFVASALADSNPMDVRGERLGSAEFLTRRLPAEGPLEEVPRNQWLTDRPSLDEILATSRKPLTTAYRTHGYRLREIAAHLGCHYATVSRRLRREEDLLDCKT